MTTSIEQARLAKSKARTAAEAYAGVVGVGLTKIGDSYAIKVNLCREPVQEDLPHSIDGVPIVYEVVGTISLRHGMV
jgi:hypothetical protein